MAHGGTNKIFFGLINHVSKSEMYNIKQDNCCLNELEFDGKTWIAHRINCTNHLNEKEEKKGSRSERARRRARVGKRRKP